MSKLNKSKSFAGRTPVEEETIAPTKKDTKQSAKKALAETLAVMSLDRLLYGTNSFTTPKNGTGEHNKDENYEARMKCKSKNK